MRAGGLGLERGDPAVDHDGAPHRAGALERGVAAERHRRAEVVRDRRLGHEDDAAVRRVDCIRRGLKGGVVGVCAVAYCAEVTHVDHVLRRPLQVRKARRALHDLAKHRASVRHAVVGEDRRAGVKLARNGTATARATAVVRFTGPVARRRLPDAVVGACCLGGKENAFTDSDADAIDGREAVRRRANRGDVHSRDDPD